MTADAPPRILQVSRVDARPRDPILLHPGEQTSPEIRRIDVEHEADRLEGEQRMVVLVRDPALRFLEQHPLRPQRCELACGGLEVREPLRLDQPLEHVDLLRSHRSRHHCMDQLTEDLAVDQLEVIQLHQLAVIEPMQPVADLQYFGTLPGEQLEALLMGAAVLPALEEHQRLGR